MSAETKHTPGPWHRNIKPASKYPIVFAGRNTHVLKVETVGLSADEVEGNIDLAAAAPESFDALYEMVVAAEGMGWDGDPTLEPILNAGRAAIAKVLGGAA